MRRGRKMRGGRQNEKCRNEGKRKIEREKISIVFCSFFVARGALYALLSLSPVALSVVVLPVLCAGKRERAQVCERKRYPSESAFIYVDEPILLRYGLLNEPYICHKSFRTLFLP